MSSKEHLLHYLVLFFIIATGFLFFLHFRFQPRAQFAVIVLVDLAYVSWGLIHHYLEKRFGWEIVAEYLLVGAVVLLAFGLTLGLK